MLRQWQSAESGALESDCEGNADGGGGGQRDRRAAAQGEDLAPGNISWCGLGPVTEAIAADARTPPAHNF